MITSVTAKTYAAVLRDIGKEKGTLDLLSEELYAFRDIVKSENDLAVFLNMPGIGKETKKSFVKKILSGRMSEDFVNFIYVLIDNDRQGEIEDIAVELAIIIDEEKNCLRVTVTTSVASDDALREKISKILSAKYGKNVIVEEIIDPQIFGGMIVRAGDTLIDGSIATRIQKMKESLLLTKIKGEAVYEN